MTSKSPLEKGERERNEEEEEVGTWFGKLGMGLGCRGGTAEVWALLSLQRGSADFGRDMDSGDSPAASSPLLPSQGHSGELLT